MAGPGAIADPIAAYRRSIAECNKAGTTDCVVKVSLKDNCGALAISADHNASYLVSGGDQVAGHADCDGPVPGHGRHRLRHPREYLLQRI